MALAVDPAEVARLRAELLERYGLTEADVAEPAEVSRSRTPERPEVGRIGPPGRPEVCRSDTPALDPAENARRRQLPAERRERIEQRDRAEQALGISWRSLDVDTFGADEPERARPSGHGAIVAALREFEALRPPWQHEAACRNVEEVSFFPEKGESAGPAKAICRACPVVDACRDYAAEHGIRHGIWGGESPGGRKRRVTSPRPA